MDVDLNGSDRKRNQYGDGMLRSDDTPRAPQLNHDAWIASLRELCGRYHPLATEPKSFTGWVRPISVSGLVGLDLSCNAYHIERTFQDTRLDGQEHYFALFLVTGHATMSQNDQTGQLAVGDVAIVDSARPAAFTIQHTGNVRWLTLQLPRRSLASHLGFEPLGGIRSGGAAAGRLLHHILQDALGGDGLSSPRADSYMQLAVYDLLGALFAPSDQEQGSRSTDKLFARVCGAMRERFADPDFGPFDVAVQTGISLRYVQKLFTERGTTCTQYLYSLRLDHAAQLLR
ncbi:MAG TPA: hypothetical protein VKQ54_04860, partial [Caulobacteraceae bacterium]|nr:hypothetical protein [Caulobacteraceae bacterium]